MSCFSTNTFSRYPKRVHKLASVTHCIRRGYNKISTRTYTYDPLGRLIRRAPTDPLYSPVPDTFTYNPRSEVTTASLVGAPEANAYLYDDIGNRIDATASATPWEYYYSPYFNALNQPLAHTYDLNGNLTYTSTRSHGYDAENRLISATGSGGVINTTTYDHQSRRIAKHTYSYTASPSDVYTEYIYDGWNLVLETITATNGAINCIEYFWGTDLSGSLQGAGGVGGLIAVSMDGLFYFPFYDQNGNIIHYVDESGALVASYTYDAFGDVTFQTGSMSGQFRFRFSTKYEENETGYYYYGYRFYVPHLGRWLTRDPIAEEGGLNLYGFVNNNALTQFDPYGLSILDSLSYSASAVGSGLSSAWDFISNPISDAYHYFDKPPPKPTWEKSFEIDDGKRRVYKRRGRASLSLLAKKVGLDISEVDKWAKPYENGETLEGVRVSEKSNLCEVSVPNVWISADLLRGGGPWSRFVNLGGTIGTLIGTDLFTGGFYIERPKTIQGLYSSIDNNIGNTYGLVVFAHGDKSGVISSKISSPVAEYGRSWTYQAFLSSAIRMNDYKLAKIYMMQCYSAYSSGNIDFETMWENLAVKFYGYKGMNAAMVDLYF